MAGGGRVAACLAAAAEPPGKAGAHGKYDPCRGGRSGCLG